MNNFAEEVLTHYAVQEPTITFIRHNENMTYKVSDLASGTSYLLRIHKSVTAGLSGIQHSLEGLQTEMELLRELDRQEIMRVQKPFANTMGEWVTTYRSTELGTVYATMLEWVEGSILDDTNIDQIVFGMGASLSDFHNFSRAYQVPAYTRPSYGAERIDFAVNELSYGVKAGVYSSEQFEIIKEVLGVVKRQMQELNVRGDAWGLIHADFQRGNVVIAEGNPVFIDFCLAGYGYFLFDVGSAVTLFKSELRRTFLEGYASKTNFSSADIRYIEGQIFMDSFISYAFFIRDAEHCGWIREHAARLCSTLCNDFLAGKEVLEAI